MKSRLRQAFLVSMFVAGVSCPALADPGDIIFARAQDADSLDVARVSTTISFQVMNQIYDNLLNLDDKGHVVGGLATSYTASPDNMTFTFTMRPNIKCHDGAVFDAKAAKWNIDRAVDPKTGSSNASSYGSISSTEVNGDVLTVKLSKPYSPLPTFLGSALAVEAQQVVLG
jgi:peptide/nickel transport system substrate-binding protein